MNKTNVIVLSAVILAISGCDGSSSSTDASSLTTNDATGKSTTLSGTVADGYLIGAKACLDLNNNKKCDADEPYDTTDEDGGFDLEVSAEQAEKYSLIAEITPDTIDKDDGLPVGTAYTLTSPAKSRFVSPITSVLHSVMEDNPQLSLGQAETFVKETFGLDSTSDLLSDYIAKEDPSVHELAQKVASILGEGLKDAKEIASADAGDDLNEDDFNNVYGVVIKEIVQMANEIRITELDKIKEQVKHEDGGYFDWKDAQELKEKVREEEMEQNQILANVEEIATNGFHRIELDYQSCRVRYDPINISSFPGTELDEIGIPSSPSLVEPPLCQPNISRESMKVVNGSLQEKFYQFDPTSNDWSEQQGKPYTTLQLLENGSWVSVGDADMQIIFNTDGTATVTNGGIVEKISMRVADLSGEPLNFALPEKYYFEIDNIKETDHSDLKAGYTDSFKDASSGMVFPQGSLAIRWSFERINEGYEIPVFSCPENATETYNSNCNIVRKPGGKAATSISPDMFYLAEDSDLNSQESLNFGPLGIQLLLKSEEVVDFDNTSSGSVRFIAQNTSQEPEQIATGEWKKENIRGTDLYFIELPYQVRDHAEDHNEAHVIFLTEHNGYVRQGIFTASGKLELENDWHLNNEALEGITNLLQSLGS